jgi:hypothetical protein
VDHAGGVGEGQGVGDPDPQIAGLGQRQPAAAQPGRQRLALEPVHRQVGLTGRRQAVGDVADDRRVGQLGQGQRFAAEALGPPLVGPGQELHRHRRAGQAIARAIDRTHAAGLSQRLEFEPLGDDRRRRHRAILPSNSRRGVAHRDRAPPRRPIARSLAPGPGRA